MAFVHIRRAGVLEILLQGRRIRAAQGTKEKYNSFQERNPVMKNGVKTGISERPGGSVGRNVFQTLFERIIRNDTNIKKCFLFLGFVFWVLFFGFCFLGFVFWAVFGCCLGALFLFLVFVFTFQQQQPPNQGEPT